MSDATQIANEVRTGATTAAAVIAEALARCDADSHNAVAETLHDRATKTAARIDERIAAGQDVGPLAGVPFLVKNLIDVAGLTTLGGSKLRAVDPPATSDAACVERLESAGAVLVGTTNMDEFAYGFTTENSHYGPTLNPLDRRLIAGGSSGGSGAAVAAGLVPIALGTDTNGSIRVPAALCGVAGHRPSMDRFDLDGVMVFARSLDTVGSITSSVRDLELVCHVLSGRSAPAEASLEVAVLGGYFMEGGDAPSRLAVELAAEAAGATKRIEIRDAALARSAAMVVTAAEGAEEHYEDLRDHAEEFDPMTRDRFRAGTHVSALQYLAAKRVQRQFIADVDARFDEVDVLLAPALPCAATPIGERFGVIGGTTQRIAPNLGLYTQPISFAHLPVVVVSVDVGEDLPRGVQVIARNGRDEAALSVAASIAAALVEGAARG